MQYANTKQIGGLYAFRRSLCCENKGRMDKKRNFVCICDEFFVTDLFFCRFRAGHGPGAAARHFSLARSMVAWRDLPIRAGCPVLYSFLNCYSDMLTFVFLTLLPLQSHCLPMMSQRPGLVSFEPSVSRQLWSTRRVLVSSFRGKSTCGSSNADVIPCGRG